MLDDRRERQRRRVFTRRAVMLFGGQLAVAGALGGRLYQLQVLESDEYHPRAESNRINIQHLAPPRGQIFDREGRALAVNRQNFMVRFIRERADDVEASVAELRRILDMSDDEAERFLKKLRRTRSFVPVMVRENLDWETFARINANAPALPGVAPDVGWVRDYPEADELAHVIGYVGAVSEEELAKDRTGDPLLRLPSARIGKQGVEHALEERLRGSAGLRRIEVNAGGREIREIERVEGAPGENLTLTIDLDLQHYTMQRLKGESAAVVVMDCWTGDLLAIASAPAFDPNKFVFGISQSDWNDLRNDEYDPLRNKALAGAYPPGSTYKMMTALAGLESGVVDANTSFTCNGRMRFGDRFFHCWRRRGHGSMRMVTGIKNSCDVYFYEVARQAGIEAIAELSTRFGVGVAPEIEIPNVRSGLMPTPAWTQATYGRGWNAGETLNVGIGQGALLMTPLQLAVMTARIANGSQQVRPRIIKAENGVEPERAPFEPLGVTQEHMAYVREGMNAVSNESGGTAYGSRIDDPEMALAGKTGTAQVRRITAEERDDGVRDNDELPWRLRDHALFVAFAPVRAPRYAISVVVEHGGGGSKAAAPVARDVLMRALYGPEPPLEAYPPHIRPEIERARREADQARLYGRDPIGSLG